MSNPGTIISAMQAIGVALALTAGFLVGLVVHQTAIEVSSLREVVDQQTAQLDRINARTSTHTKTTDRLID